MNTELRRHGVRAFRVIGTLVTVISITAADAPASPGPTAIEIWLAIAAMLSAIGAVVTMIIGVFMTKGRWKVDRGTVDKMERDRIKEEEERDTARKKDDDARYRMRVEEDERRADGLRAEMAGLTERNAEQFEVILDLRDEIAEVRQFFTGVHRMWDNEAVTEVNRLGGHLRPPPELPAHRKKRRNTRDRERDERDDSGGDRDRSGDRDRNRD